MALDMGTVAEQALKRQLRGLLLVGCCVALLGGCSTVDDWLTGEDTTSGAAETANAEEAAAEQEDYPKIADMPQAPREGLVADRGNAQYSDQELRADTPGASQRVVTRSSAGQPETVPQSAARAPAAPDADTAESAITSENVEAPQSPAQPQSEARSEAQTAPAAEPANTTCCIVPGTRPASQGRDGMEPQVAERTGGESAQAGPAQAEQTQTGQAAAARANAQPLYDRGNSPVTVNLDVLGGPVAGPQMAQAPASASAQAAVPPGGTQVAVIQFGYGSAGLDGQDREVLRQVVALQRQHGGTIQVVGHASARTGVMPVERHHEANRQISQARADAVREALVSLGAPSGGVAAQAAGDSQPLYGEMMPTGEAGNRRAEIYLVR